MLTFDQRPMPRRLGLSDYPAADPTFFDTVAAFAGGSANQLGDLSQFLMRSGYTIESIRNGLTNVAALVNGPTHAVEFATQELRYLNDNSGQPLRENTNSGLWIALAIGGLLFLATRRDN